jgi:hypothetical protein
MNHEICCPEVKDRDDIPGIDSKESIPPGILASRYDNHIPTWFLVPIDCSKIPALD